MNEDGENDDGRFERPIDPGETVVEAVVLAVASATGRTPNPTDPGGLGSREPLLDAVDPDAVEALFRTADATGRFPFHWEGSEIVIDGGASVLVTPDR